MNDRMEAIMLHIYFGKPNDSVYRVADYFYVNFDPIWFEDEMVKEIIRDIDKTEVLGENALLSPVLGYITPDDLSSGTKGLILLLKIPDITVHSTNFGDNCAKWILKIGDLKDCRVSVSHSLYFMYGRDKVDTSMTMVIDNDNSVIHTYREYIVKDLEFLKY